MSLSYTSLVGPVPDYKTLRFLTWYDMLLAKRMEYLNTARASNYYFDDTLGDDTTGEGTIALPWKTLAKAQAVHDDPGDGSDPLITHGGSDFGLWFLRGEEFISATGLSITKPNVTVGAYGTAGAAKPLFNKFELQLAISGGGWTADGSHYKRSVTTGVVGWVRKKADRLTPLTKLTSAAAVDAASGTFFYDTGAQELHVNLGADPDTIALEVVYNNAVSGVLSSISADNFVCRDIRADGWGLDLASVRQAYGFKQAGSTTSNNHALFYNCEAYYGNTHNIGQDSGGATDIPQYATFVNCDAGFGPTISGTAAYVFVAHQATGGNEFIFHNCRALYGKLPESVPHVRGGKSFHAHTGGGSYKIGLGIIWRCETVDGTYGCISPVSFTSADIVDNTIFIVKEKATITATNTNVSMMRRRHICIAPEYHIVAQDATQLDSATGAALTESGELSLGQIYVDLANVTQAKTSFFNGPYPNANIYRFNGNHFHIKGNGTTQFIIGYDNSALAKGSSQWAGSPFKNNIFVGEGSFGANGCCIGLDNAAAHNRCNALYNIKDDSTKAYGYSDGVGNTFPADMPVMGAIPVPGDSLHGLGDPSDCYEYDFNLQPRSKSAPSIGPIDNWNGYVGGGTQGGMIRKVRR